MGKLRKTKIIATLGPVSDELHEILPLVKGGVDIFRINMSHAAHEWTAGVVKNIRQAAGEVGRDVSILMDLQGPSVRTGAVDADIVLLPGDQVEIRLHGVEATVEKSTTVNYAGLVDDLSVGDLVLIDNGVIHLRVTSKDAKRIHCEAITDGLLGSRRRINLPGVRLNMPALTEKDLADVQLAAELGVDFIGLSFVRDAEHVAELRKELEERKSPASIISKIEDQEAVNNLEEIIRTSDGIMIARGDLGIECPIEELPIIQRRTVKQCIRLGRPVIVATQMLESMIENPVPTRAEVTDVANAVYEEADAIMLSGETSVGEYPAACIEVLDRIARRIERSGGKGYAEKILLETDKQKTVKSAVVLADSLAHSKILVFTKRGLVASHAANLRPRAAPIFAFSPDLAVCRAMNLLRSVVPFQSEFFNDPNNTIEHALQILRERGHVETGDTLVIVSDVLQGEFVVDSVLLRRA